jgi:DNA polymerase-3 subunit delta
MNIFLYGEDTFRSRQHLKKMIEKFKVDRDPQGLNTVVLDCEKEDLGGVMGQVLATPFLAERRMVVLERCLTATKKQELQEEILKRISENTLPESNVLVFWEDGAKPKTKVAKELYTILAKEKFAQSFELMRGSDLSRWIQSEVESRGATIEAPALQYLSLNVGGDMWRLSTLIDQLTSYHSPISVASVQLFLEEKVDDNIFNLVDAIVAKQPKKVYKMIREQYAKGEDPQFIFAMLIRQFRILLELRDLVDQDTNLSSDALAKQLGLHPFVVKKSLPFVKKYSFAELKQIFSSLLKIDIETKTGQGDQSVLLDVFVGRMVGV